MRRSLFIFLLAFTGQLYAQKQPLSFEIESYRHTVVYDDHKIVFQAQQANTELKTVAYNKTYAWFAGNQIHTTQGGYSGKLLHGLYTDFYLDNNIKEQGNFVMGLKDGIWKSWNDQGILMSQITFKEGIAEGPYSFYNANGALLESGRNRNGKLDGAQKRFVGDSISIVKYKDGNVKQKKKNWIKSLFVKNKTIENQK